MAEVFQRFPKAVTADGNTTVVRDANGEIEGVWDAPNIGSGVDLDTLLTAGLYAQFSFANATLLLHYPEANVAGVLEVVQYEGANGRIQRYTARDTGRIWVRYYGGSSWNPWNLVGGAPEALTGMMQMWAGLTGLVPVGWLLCDGAQVSRTTYAALFTTIGTVYGAGDGSTTFNLPNLTGRFPRGGTPDPGSTGGASTHVHGLTDAVADLRSSGIAATFQVRTRTSPSTRDMNRTITSAANQQDQTTSSSAGIGLTGDTDSASNVPPYLNILFIIKA
jgi:microcystin-dependent protein